MNECGRCHRIINEEMRFVKGCDIMVCRDCAEEAYEECPCCGEYVASDDMVYAGDNRKCIWCVSERYFICPHCLDYRRKDDAVEFHGQLMCSKCRNAYFSRCDICHERVETTQLMYVSDAAGKSVKVCPNCRREKFRHCANCDSLVEDYCMFEGKAYCRNCSEKCWKCGNLVPFDKIEIISTSDGDHDVCPRCYDLYAQCDFCGYDQPKEKLRKIADEWYCEDCLPKYLAQLSKEGQALELRRLDASLTGIVAGLAIYGGLNGMSQHTKLQLP